MAKLNEKQLFALDHVIAGHNLLLLGSAGTGKSFVIKEIVNKCATNGIEVALTCTTGIACSVYRDSIVEAKTIHQWSGIDDGRYSPSEIKTVLKSNPKYVKTVENIKKTQLLIIDECSMLSKKMFLCLNEVCSIKNETLLFGGMQLVLCGDFHQLAPVPNTLCDEDGDYCFKSEIFKTILPHKITLSDVVRQRECEFIEVIREISTGTVTEKSKTFIDKLCRPLSKSDVFSSVKLFATNDRVDDFNRDSILQLNGPMFEFISTDSGEKRYLSHILAPHILWLKIGAPVILLRNISSKLVNGLRGYVIDIQDNIPFVEFPTLNLKVPIKRVNFSVFSRRENKDVAVRNQLPLKLAFALTIHKAQGMTLDRLEVDCSGIFKAGQLGVAIGRARTSTELRVINFSQRACMPHPETVESFLSLPSTEPVLNKSCCQVLKSVEESPFFFPAQCGIDTDIDLNFEPDFDEEFDQVIKSIDSSEHIISLAEDFNLDSLIDKLRVSNILTPFQQNTNSILDNLNKTRFEEFCQREFSQISTLIEKIKFQGPVKCQKLGDFYTANHEYHNSTEFLFSCMKLFENEPLKAEHKHICFNVSVEIRKFILNKQAEVYTSTSIKGTERTVTNASRARVRYIGGYCVAKVRSKFINKKESLRYAKTTENQQNYEEAVYISKILSSFREDEQYILKNSDEPDSLLDTSRKQFVNRGLTNISDNLFNFFSCLSDQCLKIINNENFHKHGKHMFEMCKQDIFKNGNLVDIFNRVLDSHSVFDPNELLNRQINIDRKAVVKIIYQKIVKIFLMVLFGQFRKDILDVYKVTKKMAHRKQIQVSKSSASSKKSSQEIENATQNVKKKSDKRKRGNKSPSTQKKSHSEPSTSQSYSPQPSTSEGFSPQPSTSQSHSPKPSTSQSHSPKIDGTTQTRSPSTSKCHSTPPNTPQSSETFEDLNEDTNVLCKRCWTEDRETEWIQCDNCSGWLHRSCAGLKHHMKWKKFQKKGAVFNCNECQ